MTSLPRRIENSSAQPYAGPALTGEPSTMKTRRDTSLVAESSTEARPKRILEPATTPRSAPFRLSGSERPLPQSRRGIPGQVQCQPFPGQVPRIYELRIL
jgi:hypothetical protein